MLSVWFLLMCYHASAFNIIFIDLFQQFFRGKIEKEKKKVAQDAGFLRTEVTGGEVRVIFLTEKLN